MRKLLSIFLMAVLVASLAVPAGAEEAVEAPAPEAAKASAEDAIDALFSSGSIKEVARQMYLEQGYTEVPASQTAVAQADFPDKVYELAYMDLDSASDGLKKEILLARRQIAFSYDWGTEACLGLSVNEEEKTFTILPSFEELFPGWDVPSDRDLA